MDFLKKHYEKMLLGVVLLGLMVGAAMLPVLIANERQEQENTRTRLTRKVEPLEALDLTAENAVIRRTDQKVVLDFTTGNKLFNTMPWQKGADGRLIKVRPGNIGPEAVDYVKSSPLYLNISLDSVTTTDSGARYTIGVERQAATKVTDRRKKQYYATFQNKNDAFVIREVKGPADNPTELVLELNDTGETVSISKEKPFARVDGYLADLKYEPEKKSWVNQRVGSVIAFGGEVYNIVAITKDEVVLSAKSNNKKTPIRFKPTP